MHKDSELIRLINGSVHLVAKYIFAISCTQWKCIQTNTWHKQLHHRYLPLQQRWIEISIYGPIHQWCEKIFKYFASVSHWGIMVRYGSIRHHFNRLFLALQGHIYCRHMVLDMSNYPLIMPIGEYLMRSIYYTKRMVKSNIFLDAYVYADFETRKYWSVKLLKLFRGL